MRVLALNTSDTNGGAARAAFRLHKGLQSLGVDSQMLVQRKHTDDITVTGPQTLSEKTLAKVQPHLDSLPTHLYHRRQPYPFSPAFCPEFTASKIANLHSDIVNLHWITAGFIRVETLKRIKSPIVLTLHDSWAFTGGCHIPFDCNRYRQMCGLCPVLGSTREHDLSRRVWQRKNKSWRDIKLTVVAPSRWLADCAKSSSLFRNAHIEVVPNGLDLNRYKPVDKHFARKIFSLPQDKKIILFGAMGCSDDKNKGFHLLVPALEKIADDRWHTTTELVVFGASKSPDMPDLGMKVNCLGRLYDDFSIALLYAAADVFVAPSMQENLPNTVMEALACGTPCVAFDVGGMSDMIEHEINGYLAEPYSSEDLAKGIEWVLENKSRYAMLCQKAREKAVTEYGVEKVARRYLALYRDVLERK